MGLLKWVPLLCKNQLGGLDTKHIPGFTQSCSALGAFVPNVKANPRQVPRDRELRGGSAGPPPPDTRHEGAPECGSTSTSKQLLLQLQTVWFRQASSPKYLFFLIQQLRQEIYWEISSPTRIMFRRDSYYKMNITVV